MHLFWVAGLLLALIDIPDFSGLFGRMAHALERMAGVVPRRAAGAVDADVSESDVSAPDAPAPGVPAAPHRVESSHA
ncbi:hypothetical protein D3C86_2175550 [compost metagenome]